MARHFWPICPKNRLGVIIVSVGVGLVMAVIIPIWGWIVAVGAGLICIGWFIMNHRF